MKNVGVNLLCRLPKECYNCLEKFFVFGAKLNITISAKNKNISLFIIHNNIHFIEIRFMKQNYQVKPAAEGVFLVCDAAGNVIRTHMDTPYVPLSEQTDSNLCRDLNEIAEEHGEAGPLPVEKLRESFGYCLLSTIIECVNGGSFGRAPADIAEVVQWDRVFRLSPQPEMLMNEVPAIQPLKKALQAPWVDLPMNFSRSLEEMEEDEAGFVSPEIIAELKAIQDGFSWLDHFLTELLYKFSGGFSITSVLFFLSGRIDAEAFNDLYRVFHHMESTPAKSPKSKSASRFLIHRLEHLVEIRQLIEKHDPKLIEKLYVEKA